jgi:RNA polymerase sigma-70 factor (ECF subfamily)
LRPRTQTSHLRLIAGSAPAEPDGQVPARTPEPAAVLRAGSSSEQGSVAEHGSVAEPRALDRSSDAPPEVAEAAHPGQRRGRPAATRLASEAASPASIRRAGGLTQLSDAQLVGIAREGDSAAFETLYRRHVAFALHLAARIEGSTRDVEDVVHDAFLKAFSRIGDLSEPASFRAWLGSIVVFAVRSRLRRQRLLGMLGLGRGSEPIELDSLASTDASPHLRAQLAQIYALLRTQPTDDRIAWTLRYVEGNELEAVARLVGCSLATVKRRISRTQKFLQEHFVSSSLDVDGELTASSLDGGDDDAPSASAETTPDSTGAAPCPSRLRTNTNRSPSR